MASSSDVRSNYDLNHSGDFKSVSDYNHAKNNGFIDSNGYDDNGNRYNSVGDRIYDSGRDSYGCSDDSDEDYDSGK